MARWTELLLAALVAGAAGQASAPGPDPFVPQQPDGPARAVLLEDADLYSDATIDGELVSRLAAGAVLEYVGEISDDFGRTWYVVRDPERLRRRRDVYLAPFDARVFRRLGYRAAVLANRQPAVAGGGGNPAALAAARPADGPWWRPVDVVDLTDTIAFTDLVGISAVGAADAEVREAIDLLGGREHIADWPEEPLPGELFVPETVPALFRFDGSEWQLAQPVRFFGEAVSLLGNAGFAVEPDGPLLAGGPALHCWELVGALDPRGETAGSVAVAPAPVAPRRNAPTPRDMGPFDLAAAPAQILEVLPPAPDASRVPPRVDPPAPATGVLLTDNDGRQAVFLRQRLGGPLTARLRGRAMVLDIVARDDPRAEAATFGAVIEIAFADGRPPAHVPMSYTSRPSARRFELPFEVPDDAADVTVLVLPLDRELAVEQQGSVVFERVGLRPADWDPDPPPAALVLNRVRVSSFEGVPRYTRAAVAPTDQPDAEVERAWAEVSAADWPLEVDRLVLAGTPRAGMTPEQVAAAWGPPARQDDPPAGAGIEWHWDDGRYVVFVDGKVAVVRSAATAVAPEKAPRCPAAMPGLAAASR